MNFARITLPRAQMPKSSEDFHIVVPDHVISNIYRPEKLGIMLFAASEADRWHIDLAHRDDPTTTIAKYILDIVPQDDEPEGPGANTPGTNAGTGNGQGSGIDGGPGGNGGSSGNAGGTPSRPATPSGSTVGSQLAQTGDHTPTPLAMTMGIGFLALAGALLSYRRYLQIR